MIRVLIVDDEPIARAGLWALLEQDPEIDVVGECANGRAAVEAIRAERPDLVFLDVQMPDLDGFGVIEETGIDEMPVVVFVTAFDEHALRAFEASAIDYLVKPFDRDRFARALRRAKTFVGQDRLASMREELRSLAHRLGGEAAGGARAGGRVVLREGDKAAIVREDEIDWVESAGNYVHVHAGNARHRVRDTLAGFLSRLDPTCFVRVSRSAAVNAERVRELRGGPDGLEIVLRGGAVVPSSRRYRKYVREFFGEPPGA